jgi:hypothetical protein
VLVPFAIRKAPAQVKDIGSLLDWIQSQDNLDSKRVVVYGGSYGLHTNPCCAHFSSASTTRAQLHCAAFPTPPQAVTCLSPSLFIILNESSPQSTSSASATLSLF